MRDNPSSWSGYELALEGEEALDELVRSNPGSPELAELLSEPASSKDKPRKKPPRGSVVAKIDEGMSQVIVNATIEANARLSDPKFKDAQAQEALKKHYRTFLMAVLRSLFTEGRLWDRQDKPEVKQKAIGRLPNSLLAPPTGKSRKRRSSGADEDDEGSVWVAVEELSEVQEILEATWDALFRARSPVINKWNPSRSTFATFLVGVLKRTAQNVYSRKSKDYKQAKRLQPTSVAGQKPSVLEVVEREIEALDPEVKLLGDQQLKVLVATLPKLSEKNRRVMEARLGRDRPDYERAAFREAGKLPTRTYKEMQEYLGLKMLTHVMQSLFRARKELEKVSGLPLRGLVGVARETFGKSTRGRRAVGESLEPAMAQPTAEQLAAIAPSKTVVRKRQNPAEVWIYFETEDDLVDLLEAGYLDEDMFHQCREALCSMGW